jgi:hypothetical protein
MNAKEQMIEHLESPKTAWRQGEILLSLLEDYGNSSRMVEDNGVPCHISDSL